MSDNILEQFNLIKNIIKINHNDEVFASLIYGDGFNEAMVPYLTSNTLFSFLHSLLFKRVNVESAKLAVHSLLLIVKDDNSAELVMEICKHSFPDIVISRKLSDILNIFPGHRCMIKISGKIVGYIFIEISGKANIKLMNKKFKKDNRLTVPGFIATHYFMRNMTIYYESTESSNRYKNISDFLYICYDVLNKAPDIFSITDFLRSVYDIFSPVATVNDPFYKFVSANILSEMLKYLNPPAVMNGEKVLFQNIEERMNSDTIEQFNSDHTISMRCLLNHFIMFMNNRIMGDHRKDGIGFVTKSGGEVYRYYGLGDYTNDIDVKVFFYQRRREEASETYKDAQRNILSFMLALRYIIKNYNFSELEYNVKLEFLGANMSLVYKPVQDGIFNTRVRSILIPQDIQRRIHDHLHENKGIRLFSLDYILQLDMKIGNRTNFVSLSTRSTTSPLDVAFQPLYRDGMNDKVKKNKLRHDVTDKLYMNILSKDYLLDDLKLLLHLPERAHKHHKDQERIKFLEENDFINEENAHKLSSICSITDNNNDIMIQYQRMSDILIQTYLDNQIEIEREMKNFEDTLTDDIRNELVTTRYKTKYYKDQRIHSSYKSRNRSRSRDRSRNRSRSRDRSRNRSRSRRSNSRTRRSNSRSRSDRS